jgi:hypothetical protein
LLCSTSLLNKSHLINLPCFVVGVVFPLYLNFYDTKLHEAIEITSKAFKPFGTHNYGSRTLSLISCLKCIFCEKLFWKIPSLVYFVISTNESLGVYLSVHLLRSLLRTLKHTAIRIDQSPSIHKKMTFYFLFVLVRTITKSIQFINKPVFLFWFFSCCCFGCFAFISKQATTKNRYFIYELSMLCLGLNNTNIYMTTFWTLIWDSSPLLSSDR